MHHPPAEGNFYNEDESALKPAIIQDCKRHMGHGDKSDHTVNTYSLSRWMKKLLFRFLDL
jgi:hypothetical protein